MLKRSGPLKRKTPLRSGKPLARTGGLYRKTRLKGKRAKPRRGPVVDPSHLAFVRTLPCAACGRRPPSEPHHERAGRGLGQKSDDDRAIPICRTCHDAEHDGRGHFAGWTKGQRREWHAAEVERVMARKQALKGPVVQQRLRIRLDFTIVHETSEPGCTPALEAFSFAGAVRDRLVESGAIQGPASIAPGAYRTISTEQEPAA